MHMRVEVGVGGRQRQSELWSEAVLPSLPLFEKSHRVSSA